MAEYAGIGTQLGRGDGASPENFTTIFQVGNIQLGPLVAKTYDTTTHDNTLAGYSDFIAGLKDAGEITFKVYFDPANATHKNAAGGLINDFNLGTARNYQITPAGVSPVVHWVCLGVVVECGAFMYPVDGVQDASFKIKLKGKPSKMLEA